MPRPPRNRTGRPRPAGPYRHGAIPVIGLTGAIGAGKSRVAALLAATDAFVIDADLVGHALLDQRPVRELVVGQFGAGSSSRRVRPASRRGSTVAPWGRSSSPIRRPCGNWRRSSIRGCGGPSSAPSRATVRRGRARAVVLDAAILLEAGWHTVCDRVILVDAPREQRLARLAAARGWSEETLAGREAAQWPLERKRALADAVIVNDSGLEPLEENVRRLAAAILPPSRRASVRSSGGSTRPPGTQAAASSGPDLPAEASWRP